MNKDKLPPMVKGHEFYVPAVVFISKARLLAPLGVRIP